MKISKYATKDSGITMMQRSYRRRIFDRLEQVHVQQMDLRTVGATIGTVFNHAFDRARVNPDTLGKEQHEALAYSMANVFFRVTQEAGLNAASADRAEAFRYALTLTGCAASIGNDESNFAMYLDAISSLRGQRKDLVPEEQFVNQFVWTGERKWLKHLTDCVSEAINPTVIEVPEFEMQL